MTTTQEQIETAKRNLEYRRGRVDRLKLAAENRALEAKLRTARQTARTAIASMEQTASHWKILRECGWMQNVDPTGTGPKVICSTTAKHLTQLAAELTVRLDGA